MPAGVEPDESLLEDVRWAEKTAAGKRAMREPAHFQPYRPFTAELPGERAAVAAEGTPPPAAAAPDLTNPGRRVRFAGGTPEPAPPFEEVPIVPLKEPRPATTPMPEWVPDDPSLLEDVRWEEKTSAGKGKARGRASAGQGATEEANRLGYDLIGENNDEREIGRAHV